VTMRRVAKAVGITPMAIYRHYPDRAALLNALADKGFEELAARLTGMRFPRNINQRLTKMLEIYLEHALRNPRLFELMFLKPRQGARRYPSDFKAGRSPTASLIAKVVQEGMESG
jgi:AcrR family transcriptional regulator